jgi:hypothetical protein
LSIQPEQVLLGRDYWPDTHVSRFNAYTPVSKLFLSTSMPLTDDSKPYPLGQNFHSLKFGTLSGSQNTYGSTITHAAGIAYRCGHQLQ